MCVCVSRTERKRQRNSSLTCAGGSPQSAGLVQRWSSQNLSTYAVCIGERMSCGRLNDIYSIGWFKLGVNHDGVLF